MPPKKLIPSKNYRAALLAVDVGKSLAGALGDIPVIAKAKTRLAAILERCEAHVGQRNPDGTWAFATDDGAVTYALVINAVVKAILRFGEDYQEGLVWIVVAHGLAEDAETNAKRAGFADVAHAWRLAYRVLGWMYSRFEDKPGVDKVWGPSVSLYEQIRKAAGI